METYNDCLIKARELFIPTNVIARAHGIKIPMTEETKKLWDQLKRAKTQKERRDIYINAESDSEIEEAAMQAYLDNATTQEERYILYSDANSGSKIKKISLTSYMNNATNQNERWWVYEYASNENIIELRDRALEEYLAHATTQKERRQVIEVSTPESPIYRAAVRALCCH
jgi:hypothetical protein